jgi:hypothetical protein
MRYDYDDQIQVRYQHSDGEFFDTWVSGTEVLSRIKSRASEEQLRALKNLDPNALRQFTEELPEKGKKRAWNTLKDQMGDSIEDAIGGNLIGDSLANAVRGLDDDTDPYEGERRRWSVLLQDQAFKGQVLELAWIQLEGSFPDDDSADRLDDWVSS